MQVQQLMTQNVYACEPSEALTAAARIMWDHDCGCVPIVDGERRVVGMITDRDLAMAAYTQGKALHEIPIDAVMSRDVKSCRPMDSLAIAEAHMQKHQLRRLPVVDGESKLVGLITMNDLALEAARERGLQKRQLSTDEVALTLAGVCQPRGPSQLATPMGSA